MPSSSVRSRIKVARVLSSASECTMRLVLDGGRFAIVGTYSRVKPTPSPLTCGNVRDEGVRQHVLMDEGRPRHDRLVGDTQVDHVVRRLAARIASESGGTELRALADIK